MAPLQALAALHGFWLMLFVPPVAWLCSRLPPRRLRETGLFAFWLGAAGLATVGLNGLLTWQASADEIRAYAWQRMLYVIVTKTDVPSGQLALVGGFLWLAGRRRVCRKAKLQNTFCPSMSKPRRRTSASSR
jgi:hypothetical protein